MKKRLKNTKEAAIYRNELLDKQHGIDPIINEKITSPVLDHYHHGNQHCREVLQNEVNAFEGKVYNAYLRYLPHLTDMSLPEILRNLANYIEKNNNIPENEQVIHHTALSIDVRRFKNLKANQQCELLEKNGIEPSSNSISRSKQARKLIRDGLIRMSDIKKGS